MIRTLSDFNRTAAKVALAHSEAERLAAEHGVPCVYTYDAEGEEMFRRHGLPCVVESACNPFGVSPSAYYDYRTHDLVAIRAPGWASRWPPREETKGGKYGLIQRATPRYDFTD